MYFRDWYRTRTCQEKLEFYFWLLIATLPITLIFSQYYFWLKRLGAI